MSGADAIARSAGGPTEGRSMGDGPLVLTGLSRAAAAADGSRVRFRIEGRGGRHVDVDCDHADLERIIAYLIGTGQLAAARRPQVTPHRFGGADNVTVSPIETSDLGFMRGMASDEIVLVARMFGFDLGFAVTPFQARALHGEIERMLPRAMLRPDEHRHGHDHGHRHDRGRRHRDDGGR